MRHAFKCQRSYNRYADHFSSGSAVRELPAFINDTGLGRASGWLDSGYDFDVETAEKYISLKGCFVTSEEANKYVDGYYATVGYLATIRDRWSHMLRG